MEKTIKNTTKKYYLIIMDITLFNNELPLIALIFKVLFW